MTNPTDTNQASELYELCKKVYELTGWEDVRDFYHENDTFDEETQTFKRNGIFSIVERKRADYNTPLYTSDYLLEKLPEEIKKRVLVVTNGDRPHAGYAERDNYGNYTLDEYYWKNAQYSNEVRKALLKLIIALSEAGELK